MIPEVPGISDGPIDAILVNCPLKDYDELPRYNTTTLPPLGLGYIATYANSLGFKVGILDAEALGWGTTRVASVINSLKPRWVGANLFAVTYEHAVAILAQVSSDISVMLGGPLTKAMHREILHDSRIPRIDALVVGEAEYRVAKLLEDVAWRRRMPSIWWRDRRNRIHRSKEGLVSASCDQCWLAPDLDLLPFLDRDLFMSDPFVNEDGLTESTMVASRGCYYNCSFCGGAQSANPDTSPRYRSPGNIVEELERLGGTHNVNCFRFVDELFLSRPLLDAGLLSTLNSRGVSNWCCWDTTGRVNVLACMTGSELELLKRAGCREISLGIESGSDRLLEYMGKRISRLMVLEVIERLLKTGFKIKGYFIFGYPTETLDELEASVTLIHQLWDLADRTEGSFRASVFEFRPYPGTLEWDRLLRSGHHDVGSLFSYKHVDLTEGGKRLGMIGRDEFNYSTDVQYSEIPLAQVRDYLKQIMCRQQSRVPPIQTLVR